MHELSADEKHRLRQEMEYREFVARQLSPPRSAFASFFAHPAIVTIVGGALIALIAARLQSAAAVEQLKITFDQQLQDRKFALLSSFTDRFHKDHTVLLNLQSQKSWLAHHGPDDKYEMIWSRQETTATYRTLAEEYVKQHQNTALLAQIQVLFDDTKIQSNARALDDKVGKFASLNVDKMTEADAQQQLDALDRQIEDEMRRLAKAMADELKSHK